MNKVKWITPKVITLINQMVINNFGGTFKIKNFNSLQDIVQTLQKTYHNSQNLDLYEIGACYCYSIVKGKFFQNGNQRTGFLVMINFLEENEIKVDINEKIGFEMIKGIKNGSWRIEEILKVLKNSQTSQFSII